MARTSLRRDDTARRMLSFLNSLTFLGSFARIGGAVRMPRGTTAPATRAAGVRMLLKRLAAAEGWSLKIAATDSVTPCTVRTWRAQAIVRRSGRREAMPFVSYVLCIQGSGISGERNPCYSLHIPHEFLCILASATRASISMDSTLVATRE